MKIDTDTINYIFNVVKTSKLVNIDNIIIEPNMVRAMNDTRSVVLFTKQNVPSLSFGSIGITRINELIAQYDTARTLDNFSVDVSADNDEYATQLILKGKGFKSEYRCGDPRKINAPRTINDIFCYRVTLDDNAVSLLHKCVAGRSAESVSIISDKEKVKFELSSINNEISEITLEANAKPIQNDDGEVPSSMLFANRYPVKTLLALFKNNTNVSFEVGQKGILSFPINDLTVFVLPQV